jgi:hypothetical protein
MKNSEWNVVIIYIYIMVLFDCKRLNRVSP